MDLGSILLVLAVLILIGMYLSRPFFEKQSISSAGISPQEEEKDHNRSSLLAERDRLLTALQELDFDNTLGKIPEEDYPEQRKLLMLQGVEILKKLDSMQGKTAEDSVEARLEAVIAARRADGTRAALTRVPAVAGGPQHADDEIEQLISARRQGRKELSSGFCPKCGKPVQKSDVFCPKCGKKLT
jgi:rubrerythrin